MVNPDMTSEELKAIFNNQWTITIVGGIIVVLFGYYLNKKNTKLENKLQVQEEKLEKKDLKETTTINTASQNSQKLETKSEGYELVRKVEENSPFLREEAENAYTDQEIDWEVVFHDLSKINGAKDKVRLYLACKEGYPWVYGEVSLKDYPWLKLLKQRSVIHIKGKIVKFHGHNIELKNIVLRK